MCEGVLMHQAMAATTQPSALAAGSSLPKNDLSRFVSTQTHQELPRLILFLKKLAHLVTYLGPCLSVSFRVFRLTHSSLGHFFYRFFAVPGANVKKSMGHLHACLSVSLRVSPQVFFGGAGWTASGQVEDHNHERIGEICTMSVFSPPSSHGSPTWCEVCIPGDACLALRSCDEPSMKHVDSLSGAHVSSGMFPSCQVLLCEQFV